MGRKTQQEHDDKLAKFLEAAHQCNITLNDSNCVYFTECVKLLGYKISAGSPKPEPDRVETLLELSSPKKKEQQQLVGLFVYYAQ